MHAAIGTDGWSRIRRGSAAALGFAAVFALFGSGHGLTQTRGAFEIRTLSSRPDLVSGGDALVEVRVPNGVALNQLTLTLNGKDVTSSLRADAGSGMFRGLVGGMIVGRNELQATTKSGARANLAVTNYPITGPILSGPHLKPYECNTAQSGLGEALDANCSAPRRIWYVYRATDNTFKLLTEPAGARPSDLATTTTNDGRTVPYIVRIDAGVINRAVYQLAILDDPTPATFNAEYATTPGWNRKLVVSFGGGSGTQYVQGNVQPPTPPAAGARGARAGGAAPANAAAAAPGGDEGQGGGGGVQAGALNHAALSRGFAYVVSSELVNGRRGNGVLQGETLMMIKEYISEHYGVPKWTTGSGGSGGAIQQLVITEMYPGLLDGLMPSLTFPDSSLHTMDAVLLTTLWPKLDPAVWTPAKKTAVEGFTPGTVAAWNSAYGRLGLPTNARGCALTDTSLVYDPAKNPKGARCTTQDIRVNIYGRDPKTGFARRPTDNVGVQYGLAALNAGAISTDEFLEINEKIGGTDIEGNFIAARTEGDPVAIRAAYESGLVASYNSALANVPIIMSRSYNDARGDIHDHQRDFVVRARLQRANGRSDNTAVWISADGRSIAASLDVMNQWLDGITADPAPVSVDKVVKHKPADAADTCWDRDGKKIVEPASFDGKTACNTLYPSHSEPRLVAGAPMTNDIMKCQLKPVNFSDYKAIFTDDQKTRLKKTFATGVCDFSKPGVAQVPIKGTYQKY